MKILAIYIILMVWRIGGFALLPGPLPPSVMQLVARTGPRPGTQYSTLELNLYSIYKQFHRSNAINYSHQKRYQSAHFQLRKCPFAYFTMNLAADSGGRGKLWSKQPSTPTPTPVPAPVPASTVAAKIHGGVSFDTVSESNSSEIDSSDYWFNENVLTSQGNEGLVEQLLTAVTKDSEPVTTDTTDDSNLRMLRKLSEQRISALDNPSSLLNSRLGGRRYSSVSRRPTGPFSSSSSGTSSVSGMPSSAMSSSNLHPPSRQRMIGYDYLATSSLAAIEAVPVVGYKKGDRYLENWWLSAKKWGLLSGELKVLDDEFSRAFREQQALESQLSGQMTEANSSASIGGDQLSSLAEISDDIFNGDIEDGVNDDDIDDDEDDDDHDDATGDNISDGIRIGAKSEVLITSALGGTYNAADTALRKQMKESTPSSFGEALAPQRSVLSLGLSNFSDLFDYSSKSRTDVDTTSRGNPFRNRNGDINRNRDPAWQQFGRPSQFINTSSSAYATAHSRVVDPRRKAGGKAHRPAVRNASVPYDQLYDLCKTYHARVICVGDVHGCIDEVCDLLRKVNYHPGDLVLFLGDLVSKGPYSLEVIRLAMDIGAVSVRGNHDQEVIRQAVYNRRKRWIARSISTSSSNLSENDDGDVGLSSIDSDSDSSKRDDGALKEHTKLAMELTPRELRWLCQMPYYIRSPDLGSLFVHAGFQSSIRLADQDPWLMMTMRSLMPDGKPSARCFYKHPWADKWNGPLVAYFGHDAARGLQMYDGAVGLDTGCVYGGQLTAILLPEKKIVSVPARKAYLDFGKSKSHRMYQWSKYNDDAAPPSTWSNK